MIENNSAKNSSERLQEYEAYMRENGRAKFLHKYLDKKATPAEVQQLLIDLGYGDKISLEDNKDLVSSKYYAKILVKELWKDPRFSKQSRAIKTTRTTAIKRPRATKTTRMPDITKLRISKPAPKPRSKATHVTHVDLLDEIRKAKKILVFAGAGISTSQGIPDFRSSGGLYDRVSNSMKIKNPLNIFDLKTFQKKPEIFYYVAHMIVTSSNTKASMFHAFLKCLQDEGKLLRLYTQNVDDLEKDAGIKKDKLVQCHGSLRMFTCVTCKRPFRVTGLHPHISSQQVPWCKLCSESIEENDYMLSKHGLLKPNITFFGEPLPKIYQDSIDSDLENCDLVLFVGTSLNVEPVGSIYNKIPKGVPRVLMNREDVKKANFDVKFLGECDTIASYLCKELNWNIDHPDFNSEVKIRSAGTNVYKVSQKTSK